MTTPLLETFVAAQSKVYRRNEQERYGRPRDSAHDLTGEESAILLTVLRVQAGTLDADSLSADEQECVRYALTTETREAD